VVVDEAHNIEDACREAASGEWEREPLLKISRALIDAGALLRSANHQALGNKLRRVVDWVQSAALELKYEKSDWGEGGGGGGGGGGGRRGGLPVGGSSAGNGDDRYHTWEGAAMLDHLGSMGLALRDFAEMTEALTLVIVDAETELTGGGEADEGGAGAAGAADADNGDPILRAPSLAAGGGGGGDDKPHRKRRSDFGNKVLAPVKKLVSVMSFLLGPPLTGTTPNHTHYRLVLLPEKEPADSSKPRNGARLLTSAAATGRAQS
jgi:hypothetical protein